MELIRGLHNLRARHSGCAVTVGNFDGMHLGHQALLAQLREAAARDGLAPAVVIFEPQPREYFSPAAAPSRLTRLREKLELLRKYGAGRVLCLRFDERLASFGAETFVERILANGLGARVVIVGDDFRFGRERRGDLALLAAEGERHGFRIERAETYRIDGRRVSSSRVRAALEAGDMSQAARLLGRSYSMSGRVAHGEKRGREIGYPTLNVDLHRVRTPVEGIFAARVHGLDAGPLQGMAYIGDRPVVQGEYKRLEVHVFDFADDCYGRHVRVELVRKLREDMAFVSLQALQEQLHQDAIDARAALRPTP
ncbi:MAG: bifunctional riboflavin kinase/FAD synthetase [Gammaproteobacteria bacterium]